nr:reverse transcriptase domain-containing protein [Tanacetum cinerariifolium]
MVEMVETVGTMVVPAKDSWHAIPRNMIEKEADFKALLVEEFCPSNEMEKLESEFWNHKMVEANHAGYTDQFHKLAKLVPHLVTSSHIKRAGILTDEAVSCGTLTKGNEKRKGLEESSKALDDMETSQPALLPEPSLCETSLVVAAAIPTSPLETPQRNLVLPKYHSILVRLPSRYLSLWRFLDFVNPGYLIEVADGKKIKVDRVICNCKLELRTSLFTIDLIPLGHWSFDVIVGMDWLSEHKAEIVCHEKVVRIPLESGEILIVQGERTPRIAKDLSNVKVDEPKLSDI